MTISSGWKQTIFSIVFGLFVTLVATWYTIYDSNKKTEQAEKERYIKVKESLVSIVEEYIVNKKQIKIDEINRIIHIKSKNEELTEQLYVNDILEEAEFRVLNSKHLDFQKKLEFKENIQKIFSDYRKVDSLNFTNKLDTLVDYSKFRNAELVKEILSDIKNKDEKNSIKNFLKLIRDYEEYPYSLKNISKKDGGIVNQIFENPWILITFSLIYIGLLIFSRQYLKNRKENSSILKKIKNLQHKKSELQAKIFENNDKSEINSINQTIFEIDKEIEVLLFNYKSGINNSRTFFSDLINS